MRHMWQIKLPVATQALGIYWERVEYSLAYLSFASFNATYNPVRLMVPKIRYIFCGTLGFHGTPVEEYWARLYFSTHTEIHFDEHKSNYIFIRFIQK